MFLARAPAQATRVFGQTWGPRDFGAVGDGVADDTVALQRAFDTACSRGGTLLLGRRVYRVRTTLRVSPGRRTVRIVGTDACIESETRADQPLIEILGQGDELDLRDMTFYRRASGTFIVYHPS